MSEGCSRCGWTSHRYEKCYVKKGSKDRFGNVIESDSPSDKAKKEAASKRIVTKAKRPALEASDHINRTGLPPDPRTYRGRKWINYATGIVYNRVQRPFPDGPWVWDAEPYNPFR